MKKTKRVWVVLGAVGPERCICDTRREARTEAGWRNEGPYLWKPYRIIPATLSWDEKKEK